MTQSALSVSLSPSTENYVIWFRRDLRLHDNTALTHLIETAKQADLRQAAANKIDSEKIKTPVKTTIRALFVITPEQWLSHDMSVVQLDFIFRTLKELATALYVQLGIELDLLQSSSFSDSIDKVETFCQQHNIVHIASNYEYEVNEMARDHIIEQRLSSQNIQFVRHHDQCILPPNSVTTGDGNMYKVFTPFYNRWQSILDTSPVCLYEIENTLNAETNSPIKKEDKSLSQALKTIQHLHQKTLRLFEQKRDSDTANHNAQLASCRSNYPAGEVAACHRLDHFIADDINRYDLGRDQPSLSATSQLAAYLTVGSLSPRLCYLQAKKALDVGNLQRSSQDISRWISELAWRDFYRHVIMDRPDIVKHHAYKQATDLSINWSYDEEDFAKWCQGLTGVPLVDAAMRCLNQTGFMHNRLRMVTAMFLTKDLLIDWRWGERYFMQKLIDGDFASNNGGWQWSASVGTDAAPYFRIMNPFSQSKTHDKDAIFIKTWLPELKEVPTKILHDEIRLRKVLSPTGEFAHVDYPVPMVEHKKARLYAIEQFKG